MKLKSTPNFFAARVFAGALGTLVLAGATHGARAEVKLYPLFTDNMVLQREKPAPVWGTANPGERVTVAVGTQNKSAVAEADGNWRVTLDAMPAATSTPFSVQGENKIELQNVAVGDVWICSGQSNMAWQLRAATNGEAEIAAANRPNLRLFATPLRISAKPQRGFSVPVQWNVCKPETAASFSAVGYFFGREMQQRLNVPVGLINSSWGGTFAEAWTSRETLASLGEPYVTQIAALDKVVAENEKLPYNEAVSQWWSTHDVGTRENWYSPQTVTTDWKTVELPGDIESAEPKFDGVMWFRKEVEIPEAWAGKDLVLRLGIIEEFDDTYFNGVRVGGGQNSRFKRAYPIPANQVQAGRATIAVRVFDRYAVSGILGDAANRGRDFQLELKGTPEQAINLTGPWEYRVTATRAASAPYPINWAINPNQMAVLYNGMIAPLVPFAVRGAIWYQGESNAARADAYQQLFPAMIRDWRTQWNARQDGSEFGFFFVQLANYMPRVEEPVQSGWAELREAQTKTLSVPRTGMATIIDVGEEKDIHPKNKQDVGKRLALAALAVEHEQKLEYSGSVFQAMKIEGNTARIGFSHAAGLKTTDNAAPRSFVIRGEDGKWFAANARIEGETVVVWSDEVEKPVAVRYAWQNNPDVNLVNAAGLPAVPFRTDSP